MSESRDGNSLGVTCLFCMLGLALSLFLVGLPEKGVAGQEYTRVFVAANLE